MLRVIAEQQSRNFTPLTWVCLAVAVAVAIVLWKAWK